MRSTNPLLFCTSKTPPAVRSGQCIQSSHPPCRTLGVFPSLSNRSTEGLSALKLARTDKLAQPQGLRLTAYMENAILSNVMQGGDFHQERRRAKGSDRPEKQWSIKAALGSYRLYPPHLAREITYVARLSSILYAPTSISISSLKPPDQY